MIKILENLFIGTHEECGFNKEISLGETLPRYFKIIHACKDPCHKAAVGYTGNLSSGHQNYLIFETENDLFLNMVDMKTPLLHQFTGPMIEAAIHFISKHIKLDQVFIHCNKGESRAPSIALVYLAKRNGLISNDSYLKAKEDFIKLYPNFSPAGIEPYLNQYWNEF